MKLVNPIEERKAGKEITIRTTRVANKYEWFIRRPDVVAYLRTLKIDLSMSKEKYLVVTKDDLYNAKGNPREIPKMMGGAGHGLNKVFVAGRMPFYAIPEGIENVKIGRISEKFEPKEYATQEAKEKGFYKFPSLYHEPNEGQRERMQRWIKDTGINFESPPVSIEEAKIEVGEIPAQIREKNDKDWKEYKEGITVEEEEENGDQNVTEKKEDQTEDIKKIQEEIENNRKKLDDDKRKFEIEKHKTKEEIEKSRIEAKAAENRAENARQLAVKYGHNLFEKIGYPSAEMGYMIIIPIITTEGVAKDIQNKINSVGIQAYIRKVEVKERKS